MIPYGPTACRAALAVMLLVAGLPSPVRAQSETASVRGSVTDPSGAVISDATVRLADGDRGTETQVATNDGGFYVFPSVRPGLYTMEVEKIGFKLARLVGLTLNVQDNLEQNFHLAVGSSSEAITVTAGAENVNTTDATVSTVVDHGFLENMPLNGRTFQPLIALTPGSVTAKSYFTAIGQFSINGQRADTNYFFIDGVSANVGITQGSNVFLGAAGAGAAQANSNNGAYNNLVSIDSVQEFRIQTSTFEPEYGRTPGAQLSIVTRSGSNQWHGVLFEYLRNDIFDSRDYFAALNGLPKPAEKQNDFGGTLGGPILRNELFFFFLV
jgi:Carboxypeptidase regulatory-like domain